MIVYVLATVFGMVIAFASMSFLEKGLEAGRVGGAGDIAFSGLLAFLALVFIIMGSVGAATNEGDNR